MSVCFGPLSQAGLTSRHTSWAGLTIKARQPVMSHEDEKTGWRKTSSSDGVKRVKVTNSDWSAEPATARVRAGEPSPCPATANLAVSARLAFLHASLAVGNKVAIWFG